jgi:NADH dehydrogenase (ubiquinone) 1 beta subcomplex subunit 8
MWGPDIPPIAPHIALLQFTLASIGFVGFGFLVKHVLLPDIPAVRREYPFSGLVAELGGLEENKVCHISLCRLVLS